MHRLAKQKQNKNKNIIGIYTKLRAGPQRATEQPILYYAWTCRGERICTTGEKM